MPSSSVGTPDTMPVIFKAFIAEIKLQDNITVDFTMQPIVMVSHYVFDIFFTSVTVKYNFLVLLN